MLRACSTLASAGLHGVQPQVTLNSVHSVDLTSGRERLAGAPEVLQPQRATRPPERRFQLRSRHVERPRRVPP